MTTPTASSTSSSPPTASSSGEARVLDLAGEVCPYTFVRTRLALEDLPLGARLDVLVDHEPARRNVPRSAIEWGQEVLAVDEVAPGRWRIALCKRAC
ncbi:MAG: sulfurtransferase TusA family protein [Deltaproteobacteria bacterium]|nr:sulfurtransferase TusA family protein [Kofleriaceae bacterium]